MELVDIKTILMSSPNDCIVRVRSPNNYVVLLVRISQSETQSFLLSKDLNYIYLPNSIWAPQIFSIVSHVLRLKTYTTCEIDFNIVLLGVWHFGHLLGDHSWNLIYSNALYPTYPLLKLVDASGFNVARNLLIDNVLTHDLNCDACLLFPSPNTIIFPQSLDPSYDMCMSSSYVQSKLRSQSYDSNHHHDYVFLTSDRQARISNISQIRSSLEHKYLFINPLNYDISSLYLLLSNTKVLVSENGSILFNIFMSRTLPYFVITSERAKSNSHADYHYGGYIYNKFHDSLIQYLYAPCLKEAHHPYSDQISIGYNLCNFLLSL